MCVGTGHEEDHFGIGQVQHTSFELSNSLLHLESAFPIFHQDLSTFNVIRGLPLVY